MPQRRKYMHIEGKLNVYRVPEGVKPGKHGYRINDLQEIVRGEMYIGFHVGASFYHDLEEKIGEKIEELVNTPLLIRAICVDNERRRSKTPFVIEKKEDVMSKLGQEAAHLIYVHEDW